MPRPAWEDLGEFFDTDEFATTAVFTLLDGSTLPPVVGNFDDPYVNAKAGEYEADTIGPHFICPEAAVVGVRRKCSVVITAAGHAPRTFDVMTAPQLDGTGLALVELTPV